MHPVQSFRNRRELTQVFRDAFYGTFSLPASISLADGQTIHRLTHDMAKLLHRNIDTGNIMITQEGRGILIDWDLVNASGSLNPSEHMVRFVKFYPHQLKVHELCFTW